VIGTALMVLVMIWINFNITLGDDILPIEPWDRNNEAAKMNEDNKIKYKFQNFGFFG